MKYRILVYAGALKKNCFPLFCIFERVSGPLPLFKIRPGKCANVSFCFLFVCLFVF